MVGPTSAPTPRRSSRKGPRPKHVPVRTCVVCREQGAKRGLTRIVRQPDGTVVIDATGRLNGRGAYLCEKPSCWEKAASTGILAKALNVDLSPEFRETLRAHGSFEASAAAEPGDKTDMRN